MSESNKILDVTYGTFSCRLEGFDDSVETMKTVVTFFHDLAGHDRFMDMPPQAPDLDTLAELTGRQAGVAVEAETENNSLRLRARPDETETAQPEETRPSLRIQRPESDDTGPSSISQAIFDDANAQDAPDDDHDAPAYFDATAETVDADAAEHDAASDDPDDDLDAAPEADALDDADTHAKIDTTESVAAKLQRIRSVVGRSATPQVNETYSEDLTVEEDAPQEPTRANPLAQRLAELAQRNAALADEDEDETDANDGAIVAEAVDAQDEDDFDDDVQTEEGTAEFDTEQAEDEAPGLLAEDEDKDLAAQSAPEQSNDAPEDIADTDDDSDDDTDLRDQVAEVERTIAMRRENRSKRDELPRNVDAAMSRILSRTDQHLNEPEGRRHRDAIAQLKAAVAATEAARRLGDSGESGRDLGDVFREDLDAHEAEDEAKAEAEAEANIDAMDETGKVVQAPATPPAPLRLVPAQRVDEIKQKAGNPADRLRQIASKKDSEKEKTGGFAEFAAQKGATELADLLEAAAAYIAFVEGDDDFSRPQVMRKVQMASTDEFSREDGLRSFGRLLRQSKIIKLNNGRFQVSEDTRFRPDDQASQG